MQQLTLFLSFSLSVGRFASSRQRRNTVWEKNKLAHFDILKFASN